MELNTLIERPKIEIVEVPPLREEGVCLKRCLVCLNNTKRNSLKIGVELFQNKSKKVLLLP